VRVATRREWPEVVGSRDSIAVTDASTNELNRWRMSWISSVFSNATAAWLASDVTSSSSTEVNGMTISSTSATGRRTALASRFLLMSWTTPITMSWWSRIGTASMDLVRYPHSSSNARLLILYFEPAGRWYASATLTVWPEMAA
jgi:hypothetical protein